MKIEAEFELEKEAKNTVRCQERSAGKPPAIGTLYIQKWALGEETPRKLKLTIATE